MAANGNESVLGHVQFNELNALLKSVQITEQSNLPEILITQERFNKIKENLLLIIQSMEKNPSMVSRAAKYWGDLSLWKKVSGGIVLTVPMLVLGILAHLGFLLALCSIAGIIYTGGGIILDDHHKCQIDVTENLTQGILSLANLLELTITALEKLHHKLAEEIKNFASENEQFKEQVNKLNVEITAATELNTSLKNTHEEFDKTLFEQRELLSEKIIQFEKISKIAEYLRTLVNDMTSFTLVDEQQRKEFYNRLNLFMSDKDASFASLAVRFGEAENKLSETQEKLEQTSQMYEKLLHEQKELTNQLKHLLFFESTKQTIDVHVIQETLLKIGFFCSNNTSNFLMLNKVPATQNEDKKLGFHESEEFSHIRKGME